MAASGNIASDMGRRRVFPGSSGDIDMSISAVGYRGGTMSSATEREMESQRNRMTLEEARWTGVRKKIPGMSGIPSKSRSGLSSSFDEDPYQKYMSELKTFIRQHFRQKECSRFVPKPGQTVKKVRDLRCHCGETLPEHAGMHGPFDHFSSAEMMEEYLVPKELKEIMSRRNDTPPANLAEILRRVEWKPDCIRTTATCTFGKINFENVEHAGGKKPAKYIRMTDEDSVDNLLELMEKQWKIMEPERPNLVISVVGGAKNFKLDGRMRDTFSSGLIKAAKTTSAWLISSGFNMGVMKAVGQAVRQGQSFCWDNNRMAHVLRCIGIAPWGYVKNRRHLESIDGQGKFNANFRTSNVILHNDAVPLNPDHTHFIFVDDGYRIRYGGVAGIRARFEQKISQPQAEGGLGIPVVLVVVEGGTDCIADARKSLEHKIPVVVCAGTGRAADILAYAYTHTKTSSGGQRIMKEKHELKLMDKIFEAYGKNWKEEEIEKKTNDIKDSVQICCRDPEMLTVFHMNKHEDLDLAILSVLLKAKKGADEEQRLSQLKLALTWDRVDIAQEEIFREDVLWSTGSLDDVLTEALVKNKVKFVELILQQGVVMKEYLTVERLEKLYLEVPKHNYLYKLLHKLVGRDQLNLENVHLLLKRLLDKYDTREEAFLTNFIDNETTQMKTGNHKNARFKRPYKMLLVWALLMNRQAMAKLFWELGDEPITSALAATRIYHAMAYNLPRHESNLKDTLNACERDFEQLATEVLNECHHKDPDKAMMIAERKSPCWNEMTCLQIAAAATDQEFLASVACQMSINMIWKHGILAAWHKIVLAMIFPPFIAFGLEILNLGEGQMTAFQKLGVFYSSPLSKFAHGMLTYLTFLILHSYMVLVDFSPNSVSPLEWVMLIWIIAFFVDEIHTFIAFPSPTIKSKIRDWYDFLKWLDVFNFILAFIAFILHLTGHYSATKILYCINSIIFFMRILKIYVTNGVLGPKIFMIRRMIEELKMFIMVLLVFLLAYGVSSQGLLYHMRSPDWTILKDVFYFPYWQLYGEIFLEELETDATCTAESMDCRTFHWLVPFLLAAYLLVGNILLLTLLIAIFSHVFETVEKNSIEIWKYQMYFLVMEYENKTFLVPPFSLFQHIFLAVRWIGRKTCCYRKKDRQNYAKRHLEYLQLFEKEMMMNYLRQVKSEEMSGIETTVSSLQKRVDELTKLIEDEVIADQQPNMGPGQPAMIITAEEQLRRMSIMDRQESWPDTITVLDKTDNQKLDTVIEENVEEQKKKKHKHKKKKKHRTEDKEELVETKETNLDQKPNNMNLPPNIPNEPEKPSLTPKVLSKNTESGLLPKFKIPDDSDTGTDNALQSFRKPSSKHSGLRLNESREIEEQLSPRTRAWRPRHKDDGYDDKYLPHRNLSKSPSRHRFSNEVVEIEELSSEDSEATSRHSFQKLRKKKRKKRSYRNISDSDDI